ncbi:MAG TPA: hypothetical protein PKH39_16270 [Woeseiaceae bacterium]|nr:hypothetical protein [Woeseiaceae bacterium]
MHKSDEERSMVLAQLATAARESLDGDLGIVLVSGPRGTARFSCVGFSGEESIASQEDMTSYSISALAHTLNSILDKTTGGESRLVIRSTAGDQEVGQASISADLKLVNLDVSPEKH